MKSVLALAALALGTQAVDAKVAEKPEIVLVHGAFEDASIWKGVEARLHKDGYVTRAIDLPGRPSNPLSPQNINLAVYRDTVLAGIAHASHPVVLVGHSFGGIVISAVAEAAPEKIKTLVYVAALLPRDGDSLLSLAQTDPGSQVGPHLQIRKDEGLASIDHDARAELFANDGPPQLKAALPDLIVDEPLGPLAEPVHLTSRAAGVDKTYIHTSQDHVVSPGGQAAMVAATPVRLSFTLNTGHTPFLTDVNGLADAIEKSAK